MKAQCSQKQEYKYSVGTTELYYSRKKQQHSFDILKSFLSDTHQSMKMSDSDLKGHNRYVWIGMLFCAVVKNKF